MSEVWQVWHGLKVSKEEASVLKALKTANVIPLCSASKDGASFSALTLPSAWLDSTLPAGPGHCHQHFSFVIFITDILIYCVKI